MLILHKRNIAMYMFSAIIDCSGYNSHFLNKKYTVAIMLNWGGNRVKNKTFFID